MQAPSTFPQSRDTFFPSCVSKRARVRLSCVDLLGRRVGSTSELERKRPLKIHCSSTSESCECLAFNFRPPYLRGSFRLKPRLPRTTRGRGRTERSHWEGIARKKGQAKWRAGRGHGLRAGKRRRKWRWRRRKRRRRRRWSWLDVVALRSRERMDPPWKRVVRDDGEGKSALPQRERAQAGCTRGG